MKLPFTFNLNSRQTLRQRGPPAQPHGTIFLQAFSDKGSLVYILGHFEVCTQITQRGKCHHGSGLLISAVAPTASGHVPCGRPRSLPGPDPALHWSNRVYLHNNKAAHCPAVSAAPVYLADLYIVCFAPLMLHVQMWQKTGFSF